MALVWRQASRSKKKEGSAPRTINHHHANEQQAAIAAAESLSETHPLGFDAAGG